MEKFENIQLGSGAMSKRSSIMAQSKTPAIVNPRASDKLTVKIENSFSEQASNGTQTTVHPESIQNVPARKQRSRPFRNRQHTMSLYEQHSMGASDF